VKTHNLRTAVSLGWINTEQVTVVVEALGKDPRLDVADFMFKQGWFDVQHVHWLQKMITRPGLIDVAVPLCRRGEGEIAGRTNAATERRGYNSKATFKG